MDSFLVKCFAEYNLYELLKNKIILLVVKISMQLQRSHYDVI